MESPTKATPAGCVIGLVGIALVGYAIVCGWVCYLGIQSTEIVEKGSLLRLGWRWALDSDMSDPDDPGKPTLRF